MHNKTSVSLQAVATMHIKIKEIMEVKRGMERTSTNMHLGQPS
jgi:hypothetical protein